MLIENQDRILLLKLMNALYGISLAEEALNTQEFLSKIILFFKYYTENKSKLVRLKEELDMVLLFGDLMAASSGTQGMISVEKCDKEMMNIYVPSRSILMLVRDISANGSRSCSENGKLVVSALLQEEAPDISIVSTCSYEKNQIRAGIEDLKRAFAAFDIPCKCMETGLEDSQQLKIAIRLTAENGV